MTTAKDEIRRFLADDESGSFSIEAMLMFPMLTWGYIAMYTFFEGLREHNINLKAAYTVADLLSRETEVIDQSYLNGMNGIFGWLTRSNNAVSLRVTVVRYDADADNHVLEWSRGTNGRISLNQEQMRASLSPHIPILADADTAIVVETWAHYSPPIDMGMEAQDIYNVVVTAPRFAEQLRFDGVGDGTGTAHDDGTDASSDV